MENTFNFLETKFSLGEGKFGPVDLIIHNDGFYALKRVPIDKIDNVKRYKHLQNEKEILNLVKGKSPYIVSLNRTFILDNHVNLIFEYIQGKDLLWIMRIAKQKGMLLKHGKV